MQARPTGATNRNKGKGKGKNKSKSKGGLSGCAMKTPDDKNICYTYNNQNETCTRGKGGCAFMHVCGICFKDYPMYKCTGRGPA